MKLARTGSHILGWRAVQKAAGALTVLAVAQGLGPEGNGRYSLTLMVVTVLAAVLSAGVGLAAVPQLRRGEVATRRILAAQALWIGVVMLLLVAGFAAIGDGLVRNWLETTLTWDASLLVPPLQPCWPCWSSRRPTTICWPWGKWWWVRGPPRCGPSYIWPR